MRVLRKQIRRAILASLSAATLACSGSPASSGSTSGTCSGSSSSTTSSGTTTGGGTTGAGSTTSTTGGCASAPCCPPPPSELITQLDPFDGGFDDGGSLDLSLCQANCPWNGVGQPSQCAATPADGGLWTLDCHYIFNCTGRRTGRQVADGVRARDPLGAYLAQAAHLEAASIPAFERLADELQALDAPRALIRAAQRARADEVRHARTMSRLARAHGAEVPRVQRRKFRSRSLLALARENAVEGCVRETFGAALALHQATHAELPELRQAMKTIADEELQHAELAWKIDDWAQSRLDPAERKNVERARRRAAESVRAEADSKLPAELRALAGLPDAEGARALVDALGLALAWR